MPGQTIDMPASIATREDGVFRISGELDFSSVPQLLEDSNKLFDGQARVVIDLEGVSRVNSAGLVLLLEWVSRARQSNREFRIRHLPPSLKEIAEVSNVVDLLPVEPG